MGARSPARADMNLPSLSGPAARRAAARPGGWEVGKVSAAAAAAAAATGGTTRKARKPSRRGPPPPGSGDEAPGRPPQDRGGPGRRLGTAWWCWGGLTEMPITGEKFLVVQKVVADPLDSPPIASIGPTQEPTGHEIIIRDSGREIDPVLFIHLLTRDNFPPQLCSTEHWEIVEYLT